MARIDTNYYIDPSIYSNTRAVVANPVTPGINPSVPTPSYNTTYGTVPQYTGTNSTQGFSGAPSTSAWNNAGASSSGGVTMINGAHEMTNYIVNQGFGSYKSAEVQQVVSDTIDKSLLTAYSIDEIVEDAVVAIMNANPGISENEARKLAEGNGTKENPGLRRMLTAVDPSTGLTVYDQLLLSHGTDIADAINNQVAGNQTSKLTNEIIQASKHRLNSAIKAMMSAYVGSAEMIAKDKRRKEAEQVMEISFSSLEIDPEGNDKYKISRSAEINNMLAQNEAGAEAV